MKYSDRLLNYDLKFKINIIFSQHICNFICKKKLNTWFLFGKKNRAFFRYELFFLTSFSR